MSNIISIGKYIINKRKDEEAEKIQKKRDMAAIADSLIQEAYKMGVCPTCGGLAGRHGTYCNENPYNPLKYGFKKHNNIIQLRRRKKM
jgi:hypothetical protein